MPNWCNNVLTLTHKDPAMIERAVDAVNRELLLQEFVPCPQDLLDTSAGFFGDGDKQRELELKEQANIEKYGYKNWYDWCVANWGTKWDVCEPELLETDSNTIKLAFDSAWAPPIEAYNGLLELGFEVDAMYNEFGMAFCGWYCDGTDQYFEYTSDTVGSIPRDLDEQFGISEAFEAWEAEESLEDDE